MKGYELSRKDSEPSSLPTQVSVTVGDVGGRGSWGGGGRERFEGVDWGGG